VNLGKKFDFMIFLVDYVWYDFDVEGGLRSRCVECEKNGGRNFVN
jgi:hypothetical protein